MAAFTVTARLLDDGRSGRGRSEEGDIYLVVTLFAVVLLAVVFIKKCTISQYFVVIVYVVVVQSTCKSHTQTENTYWWYR